MNFSELCRFLNEKIQNVTSYIHTNRPTDRQKKIHLAFDCCVWCWFCFFVFRVKVIASIYRVCFRHKLSMIFWMNKNTEYGILWIEIGARTAPMLLSFGLLKVVFPEFDRFLPILWKAFLSKLFTRSAKVYTYIDRIEYHRPNIQLENVKVLLNHRIWHWTGIIYQKHLQR